MFGIFTSMAPSLLLLHFTNLAVKKPTQSSLASRIMSSVLLSLRQSKSVSRDGTTNGSNRCSCFNCSDVRPTPTIPAPPIWGSCSGQWANTDEHPRMSKCACYDQVVAFANSRNRKKPPFYFIFSNYSSVHFTHLFFLLWPHHSLWKFSGQGRNPSRSFWPITGSLNPLDQARDHSSTVTQAAEVRFLTYCHSRNSSKQPFRAVFPGSEVGEG